MATTNRTWVPTVGVLCRTGAAALIAGVWPGRTVREVNASLVARPLRDQAVITVAVLGALFGLSLLAAQFGWIGILAFWLAVIVLVN